MLTGEQILAAAAALTSEHLSDVARQQLLTLIRALPKYRDSPGLYPDLATKLADATGITAQILQAALTQVEAVGAGEESLGGKGGAGVSWSRADNRYEFVADALNALYDVPALRPASAVVQSTSSFSWCSIHGCSLNRCGCGRVPMLY